MEIRKSSFAGSFYPEDKEELKQQINEFIKKAKKFDIIPKALIVPHAGYIYSGQTAAYAYKLLDYQKNIILLGPSHNPLKGAVYDPTKEWETPLGKVDLFYPEDLEANFRIHKNEHSLEVQLPFLQIVLDNFKICPILVGDTDFNILSKEIEKINHDLIIVSSDLSHYHSLLDTKVLDEMTITNILSKDLISLQEREACGILPILTLLKIAKRNNWKATLLNYSTSYDSTKDKKKVVGYAAIAFQ